jgi:hypothetical protein
MSLDSTDADGATMNDALIYEVWLGACCICHDESAAVRNVMMLERRAPIAGHGWGCVGCRLPMDGAYAVLCDQCLPGFQAGTKRLAMACNGWPGTEGRVPIEQLSTEVFKHDDTKHAPGDGSPPYA